MIPRAVAFDVVYKNPPSLPSSALVLRSRSPSSLASQLRFHTLGRPARLRLHLALRLAQSPMARLPQLLPHLARSLRVMTV